MASRIKKSGKVWKGLKVKRSNSRTVEQSNGQRFKVKGTRSKEQEPRIKEQGGTRIIPMLGTSRAGDSRNKGQISRESYFLI
jgi:hypothetical protein